MGQLHEGIFSFPEALRKTLTELQKSLDVLARHLLATDLLLEHLIQLNRHIDHALQMHGH